MTSSSQHEPQEQYTASEEWAALVTLAAADDPARAVAERGWMREHFASPDTAEAFAQLAEAHAPVLLNVPEDYASASASSDLEALRESLGTLAASRTMTAGNRTINQRLRAGADPRELIAAQRELLDIADRLRTPRERNRISTLGMLAEGYWARISEQREAAPTGLGTLDSTLGGGLQSRRLMILLGGPGAGKTTFANQIAEHLADAGRAVVYWGTEDTPEVLLAKHIARLGNIDYSAALQGRKSERERINATLQDMIERGSSQRLLYIEDTGRLSLDTLRTVAGKHFKTGNGPGLLVVDYLQRIARAQREAAGGVRELRELVSWLTERLGDLARELDCTVLALASQNRASGYNTSGSALASAKESGDVEFTADVLMAIGEDTERKGGASFVKPWVLRIDKNRQGPTGKVDLDWYRDRQKFSVAGQAK